MLLFLLLDILFPLEVKVPYARVVTASDGQVLYAGLSTDEKWRMKMEPDERPVSMIPALLFKEDRHFYYHPGIDPAALIRAVFRNFREGKKTSGASTITMQVARLLFPAPRTYGNKFREMFRSLQLEMHYTKEEILQLYLDLLPFGGNMEGLKAASLLYFGKPPALLSLAQVVTLTIIPNRPSSLKPGKNDGYLQQERNKWLNRMREAAVFNPDEIRDALAEPVSIRRLNAPRETPQFALQMMRRFPQQPTLHTTIRVPLQRKAEAITFQYMKRLRQMNIHNAAVLVVENKSSRVRAYVGSADFSDAAHAGEVDGVMAVRSPGSTLKPLVYGLAMDEGVITPKTVLLDVPVNFAGYRPENYNNLFNGKVTAEKALAFSLNVPAVKMLNAVGVDDFCNKLNQAGFVSVWRNKKNMGLSMVLGGCGVTLFELAGLYACLANEGLYRPLKLMESDTGNDSTRLLAPGASWMLSEILTLPLRPDLPNHYESTMHLPRVAWKTGTSYGRRDAWSIGYNRTYTIAVWVGNFDGTGVPELSGADIATPLLFQLFNSIDYNSSGSWFVPPAQLDFRLVCPETGLPPGENCTDQVSDYFIPGVSPYQKCTHLREYFLSADGSYSYCMQCLPADGYRRKKFSAEDPALMAWYRASHTEYPAPPPHNPACTRVLQESPPVITSPLNDKEYLLQKGQEEVLELKCQVSTEVSEVYWYIDNRFFKKVNPAETVFFQPHAGICKISCSDDQGRNVNCTITVTFY